MTRVSWVSLSRWAREILGGHTLEAQERLAIAQYPAYISEIKEAFAIGKVQLRAIEGQVGASDLGAACDFWRMFSHDQTRHTAG